jgi:hypothetical protein
MRTTLVPSAQYWFNAARAHQNAGRMPEALLAMEQALQHTESALAHVKGKVPGVKEEMERVENFYVKPVPIGKIKKLTRNKGKDKF